MKLTELDGGKQMLLPQGLIPLLPMKNTVLFTGLTQVIKVGRERSINALKKAEKNGFFIVAVPQKQKENETQQMTTLAPAHPQDIYGVGTLARIESMKGNPESGYQVVLRGMGTALLEDIRLSEDNYLQAESTLLEDTNDMNKATESALLESLKSLSKSILKLIPANTDQLTDLVESVDDLSYLIAICAGNCNIFVRR
jgi:ATP-dependent Lon protease